MEVKYYIEDNNLVVENNGDVVKFNLYTKVNNKLYNLLLYNINYGDIKREILLEEKILLDDKEHILVIYRVKKKMYYYVTLNDKYKHLVLFKSRIIKVKLSKKRVKIICIAFLLNKFNLNISNTRFSIDDKIEIELPIKNYDQNPKLLKKLLNNLHILKFNVSEIIENELPNNNSCLLKVNVNGENQYYNFRVKRKVGNDSRVFFVPIVSKYIKHKAIHFRSNKNRSLIMVQRDKEEIEYDSKFKFYESKIISSVMYSLSRIHRLFSRKKINIYYEKFCSKAEEGTWDIFLKISDDSKSKNYFIINKNSDSYENIKDNKNVIPQFSLKFYWKVYCSNNFISTEAPGHIGLLRSNNKIFRKCLLEKKFIFLQHGVTYMKRQGKNSAFIRGKEAASDYIVVGSEKEKNIVSEMLKMPEDDILVTGLPIFSKIDYNHINKKSKNIATVMLTWKPYEEHLEDFTESSYYKNTVTIYEKLCKYLPKDQIRIVAHPKVENLLEKTDLKDNMWKKSISEVLNETKLLITDYSSVCYNTFYQGGGVIFFQEDIELYEIENGKLIPDDSEYIGYRAFSIDELDKILKKSISKKEIDLVHCRTKEFIKNYKLINEFSDGKNIDRIYETLKEKKII